MGVSDPHCLHDTRPVNRKTGRQTYKTKNITFPQTTRVNGFKDDTTIHGNTNNFCFDQKVSQDFSICY